jgi:hypothetical protein
LPDRSGARAGRAQAGIAARRRSSRQRDNPIEIACRRLPDDGTSEVSEHYAIVID